MGKSLTVIVSILALLLLLPGSVLAQENAAPPFSDVPKDHWAYQVVHDLRSLGITDGVGNNRFGIGLPITRCEFVTFLVRLLQWELVRPPTGSFADNMDPTKWYYDPIETALKHGAILKDGEVFRVSDAITREEMAVMIIRALGYDELAGQLTYLDTPFHDVTENKAYINMAKDFGILQGVGGGLFKPKNYATREEAAAMMMRMHQKYRSSPGELHAFYAIRSAKQMDKIKDLHSAGFGWSRLEYDREKRQVVLNTTTRNNNEFAIPAGFSQPLAMAAEHNILTLLMVFADNASVPVPEKDSGIPLTEYILASPEVRRSVIASILAQINGAPGTTATAFDGVIIDFEYLRGEQTKHLFNTFLSELQEALKKNRKKLYVTVHPARRDGQAYYDGYDFKTISALADRVILMAHDYYAKQLTVAEMENGYTITPLTPFAEVYYALKAVTDAETGVEDVNKLFLQISFDSVQWKLRDGKVINRYPYHPDYEAIRQRLTAADVTLNYSTRYQNPYAAFYDQNDNTDNVIWYEDARSVQAKIDLAKMFSIRNISLWRLGNIPDFTAEGTRNLYLDVWQQITMGPG